MRLFYKRVQSALECCEHEEQAYSSVSNLVTMNGLGKARLFFVGNGGSAAIASHMAADWMKNAGFPTFCFNDGPSVTAISNDVGYDRAFAIPIAHHGAIGDVLFAISSSGNSPSILEAIRTAKDLRMNVVTLSGFGPNNSLRKIGHVNFYVKSDIYGVVETAHLAILHSILDEVIRANGR